MLVAVHSDTWLYAVAFYNGARLNKDGRCVVLSIAQPFAVANFCSPERDSLNFCQGTTV